MDNSYEMGNFRPATFRNYNGGGRPRNAPSRRAQPMPGLPTGAEAHHGADAYEFRVDESGFRRNVGPRPAPQRARYQGFDGAPPAPPQPAYNPYARGNQAPREYGTARDFSDAREFSDGREFSAPLATGDASDALEFSGDAPYREISDKRRLTSDFQQPSDPIEEADVPRSPRGSTRSVADRESLADGESWFDREASAPRRGTCCGFAMSRNQRIGLFVLGALAFIGVATGAGVGIKKVVDNAHTSIPLPASNATSSATATATSSHTASTSATSALTSSISIAPTASPTSTLPGPLATGVYQINGKLQSSPCSIKGLSCPKSVSQDWEFDASQGAYAVTPDGLNTKKVTVENGNELNYVYASGVQANSDCATQVVDGANFTLHSDYFTGTLWSTTTLVSGCSLGTTNAACNCEYNITGV